MTFFNSNEKELLAALKKGDQNAYEYIYVSYYEKLCRYIFSLSNDIKEAEDIAQDTLLNIWEKKDQLNIQTSLNAYLYKTSHNTFINRYLRDQRHKSWIATVQRQAIIEIENDDITIKQQRLQKLRRIIEQLPEKRKEVFILNKLKNYKYKEIAVMLKISERTVESQIRKSLIFIREQMKDTILTILLFWFLHYSFII